MNNSTALRLPTKVDHVKNRISIFLNLVKAHCDIGKPFTITHVVKQSQIDAYMPRFIKALGLIEVVGTESLKGNAYVWKGGDITPDMVNNVYLYAQDARKIIADAYEQKKAQKKEQTEQKEPVAIVVTAEQTVLPFEEAAKEVNAPKESAEPAPEPSGPTELSHLFEQLIEQQKITNSLLRELLGR